MEQAFARMNGARLAFVVVPLEGKVMREYIKMVSEPAGKNKDGTKRFTTKLERTEREEPAGYMVYFPRGHALRFKDKKDLVQYGLNHTPHVINLQGLLETGSAAGQLLMQQDEATRRNVFEGLEQQVIKLATAKSGHVLMPEQVRKPPTLDEIKQSAQT